MADLPSSFASKALYAAYIMALSNTAELMPAMNADDLAAMQGIMNFTAPADATKVFAVDIGDWETGSNWHPDGVPGDDDRVLIGADVLCFKTGVSNARLHSIRLEGALSVETTANTKTICDTCFSGHHSHLSIGGHGSRIQADKTARFITAANGPIDIVADPYRMTRGWVLCGHVHIMGAEKTEHARSYDAAGPLAGATSYRLEAPPTGWRVGDKVIWGATRPQGKQFSSALGKNIWVPHEGETVTLTAVNGDLISWAEPLAKNHNTPAHSKPGLNLRASISNLTHNVSFESEDIAVPVAERPHLMFMHNHDDHLSLENYSVTEYGRTSKYCDIDGVSASQSVSAGQNWLLNGAYGASGGYNIGCHFVPYLRWSGAAQITIDYINAAGNPASVTSATLNGEWRPDIVMQEITEISTNANITVAQCGLDCRSFAVVLNGGQARLKNWHGNSMGALLTYDTIYERSNVQGRYPVHFHKLSKTSFLTRPYSMGHVVINSPGWGTVVHACHMTLVDCTGVGVFGADFVVGETGAETGLVTGCVSYNCGSGGSRTRIIKDGWDMNGRDFGRMGSSFWATGRAMKFVWNKGFGAFQGFIWNVRGESDPVQAFQLDHPEVMWGAQTATIDDPPIHHFYGNEIAAVDQDGVHVIKFNPEQGHDDRTLLENFLIWSANHAELPVVHPTYTENYTFKGFTCIAGFGNTSFGLSHRGAIGIGTGSNAADQIFINSYIEGYSYAIDLKHENTQTARINDPKSRRIVAELTDVNCTNKYKDLKEFDVVDLTSDDLDIGTLELEFDTAVPLWTANLPVTGTKTDAIGEVDFPSAFGQYIITYQALISRLARWGYRTYTGKKLIPFQAFYTCRATGETKMKILPVEPNAQANLNSNIAAATNRGACDLTITTPPTLSNISATGSVDNDAVVINVLASASGSSVEFASASQPRLGRVVMGSTPQDPIIYKSPYPGWTGTESFYVWVMDANFKTQRATVTVEIEAEATVSPIANDDFFGDVEFEGTKTIYPLNNDENTTELVSATVNGGAGTCEIVADNGLKFDPADDFSGAGSITCTINPGGLTSTAFFNVLPETPVEEPEHDPPVQTAIGRTRVKYGVPTQFNLLRNISHPDGVAVTLASATCREGVDKFDPEPTVDGYVYIMPGSVPPGLYHIDGQARDGQNTVVFSEEVEVLKSLALI